MEGYGVTLCVALFALSIGVNGSNTYNFMFLRNYVEEFAPLDVEFYVASRSSSDQVVSISNPSSGGQGTALIADSDRQFTIAANTVRKVTLPSSSRQESDRDYKCVRVVSSDDVILYALNRNRFSNDGFTVFSDNQIGYDYYAVAYSPADYNTQVGIIATEPDVTTVTVTVPSNTFIVWENSGYGADDVIIINLQQFETALVKADSGDVTGSHFTSNKRIAVFSGNVRTSVDGVSRDHLIEQLPPVNQWGFNYFTVRTPDRLNSRPDVIRILAQEDNTLIEVTGDLDQTFSVNAGKFQELNTYGALSIRSDKEILVAVISTSQVGNSNDAGDPSLVVVPPVRHYGTDYMFATPEYTKPPTGSTSNQYDINIIVVVKSTEADGLSLNGVAVQSVDWTGIANSSYLYGYIPVADNRVFTLSHSNPYARYMALLYGSADRESFYFPLDIIAEPVLISGEVGDQGEQGSTGFTGVTGQQGETGEKGSKGDAGLQGQRGVKGAKGSPGASSLAGVIGQQGATGATGDQGEPGVSGAVGNTGSTGATGSIGATGEKGERGNQGVKGEPGEIGEDGPRGLRGIIGAKGQKGQKGAPGVIGPKGPQGTKGEEGAIDRSGCSAPSACLVEGQDSTTAACIKTFGSETHVCSCPIGYRLMVSDPNRCTDVNECLLELCSHGCNNMVGSYECSCPEGYNLVGNSCIDIDECKTVSSSCVEDQLCINTVGSFVCYNKDAPSGTARLRGLQSLLDPAGFIAMLCLLSLTTLLLVVVLMCLLVNRRRRLQYEAHKKSLIIQRAVLH